jgi:hypothetical protein
MKSILCLSLLILLMFRLENLRLDSRIAARRTTEHRRTKTVAARRLASTSGLSVFRKMFVDCVEDLFALLLLRSRSDV